MAIAPGTILKGNELCDALAAIDHATGLTYTRAETARRAVAASLACLGARRIYAAFGPDPDGSEDRRIVGLCAEVEIEADRLDQIPKRVQWATERTESWAQITATLRTVRQRLLIDARLRGSFHV